MDDSRCKYINKTCPNARSMKENGELHRLCTFHRAKAVDAQRRWHSRRRGGGVKRRASATDDDSGGDTYANTSSRHAHANTSSRHAHANRHADAHANSNTNASANTNTNAPAFSVVHLPLPPPLPSPKRRHIGAPELPALAEVMMMLRQRRPVADPIAPPPPPPHEPAYEAAWPRYYAETPPPPTAATSMPTQLRYYEDMPSVPIQSPYHREDASVPSHSQYYREDAQHASPYREQGSYGAYAHESVGAHGPHSRSPPSLRNLVPPLHAYTREYRGAEAEERELSYAQEQYDAPTGYR